MTMTLPSFCSAIRSQLYFSQISAWTEQLKTTTPSQNNPRIKPNNKLDILYRIRPFDNTSYFNDTPNTHNFPDTIVAEGEVIKVCLKSLPRLAAIPTLQQQQLVQPPLPTTSSTPSIPDRQPQNMCTEKGKHRCESFEEDESSNEMETNSCSPVVDSLLSTHRNRQLEKYRRRLQKRDQRKKKDPIVMDETPLDVAAEPNCINSIRPPLYAGFGNSTTTLTTNSFRERQSSLTSVGTQTDESEPGRRFREQASASDDDSSGASAAAAFPHCDLCGIEMQYICWNCDNKLITPSSPGRTVAKEPHDKAILLLQSIQRTPSAKQLAMIRGHSRTLNSNNNINNSGRPFSESGEEGGGAEFEPQQQKASCDNLMGVDLSDCRLCKRQKTMHNYFGSGSSNLNNNNITNHSLLLSNHNNNNNFSNNNYNQGVSFKCPSSRIGGNVFQTVDDRKMSEDDDVVDESSAKDRIAANYHRRTMSESLDVGNSVHTERESDMTCRSADHRRETVLTEMELKMYRRAYSEDVLALGCDENPKDRLATDFYLNHHPLELSVDTSITTSTASNVPITCSPSSSLSAMSLEGTYKKPRPPSDCKPIPKVNLSRVFGLSSQPFDSSFSLDSLSPSQGSSATSIGLVMASSSSTTDFIPVHKSNSAPSFQAANLLSPRFLKQAAIQKRRSRHLSDRSSERSSIGSDEPFSDEEFGGGLDNTYIAMLSPINGDAQQRGGFMRKVFPKSYPFGKKTLLGE